MYNELINERLGGAGMWGRNGIQRPQAHILCVLKPSLGAW